eukprot:3005284-Prymnesium_polylepis.1
MRDSSGFVRSSARRSWLSAREQPVLTTWPMLVWMVMPRPHALSRRFGPRAGNSGSNHNSFRSTSSVNT